MYPRSSRLSLLLVLGIASGLATTAQTVVAIDQAAAVTAPADSADRSADLQPASPWMITSTLRASLGWRDNLLLSSFDPIERPFARAEAELFVYRPLGERGEFVSFLNGDLLRYASPPAETDGEDQWFGHVEARWRPWNPVRLALKTTGFIEDAVIDLSETEGARFVAPTHVQGAFATALVRMQLPAGFAVEPMGQVKRTDYREFSGDHDTVQTGVRLEWKRSDALVLSISGYEQERRYADRNQFTAGGRRLTGTRLRFTQHEGEARASSTFTAAGKWTLSAAAGRLENRDNGSGFFDYDQDRFRVAAKWEIAGWQFAIEGDARRTEYLVQTVGAGMAPPARIADYYEAKERVERQFGANWMLFAEHRWERDRSNEFGFSYKANTVLAGIQRDF